MSWTTRLAMAAMLLAAAPAAAKDARVWRADSAGVRYELTADSLVAQPATGAAVAVSGEYRRLANWKAEATLEFARGVYVEYALEPVAIAGPYLSLAVDEYIAPYPSLGPNIQRTFATYRVGPGLQRVSLTELFGEQAVLRALLADAVIRRHLRPGRKPATVAELIKRLDDPASGAYTFHGEGRFVDSFALHHVKGRQVAVRIALPGGNAAHRTARTELGLYLDVPPGLKGPLATAAARRTLMGALDAATAKVAVQKGEALPDEMTR